MAATIDGTATNPIFNAGAGAISNSLAITQSAVDTVTFTGDAADPFAIPADPLCVLAGGDVTCIAPGGTLASITANMGDGDNTVTTTGVTAPMTVNGGTGADTFTGGDGADTLSGGAGDDGLAGGAGIDTLTGGLGADLLDGGAGADVVNGDAGDDTITLSDGADVIDGGANDTVPDGVATTGDVIIDTSAVALNITLDGVANDGAAGQNANVGGVESVLASGTGNADITGSSVANLLSTGTGNDTIRALDGVADFVFCDTGTDIVYADAADSVATTCEASTDKAALAFGSHDTGTATTQTVTVKNTGAAALPLGTASTTGAFTKGTDTCSGQSIGVGNSCTVDVAFVPAAAGAAAGTLTIPTAGSSFLVGLGGTGTTPGVVTPPVITPPVTIAPITTPPVTTPPVTKPPVTKPTPKSLSAKVTPTRDRSKPYKFTVKGKLGLPTGVSTAKGCSGTVTVTVKKGTKILTTKKATLKGDCSYTATATVKVKGKLKISAKFGGNSALNSKSSATLNARAG